MMGMFEELSPREKEIYALAIEGANNKEIAAKLGIGYQTVKNHFKHIYQKLEVYSRIELIHLAVKLGHLVIRKRQQ
jgi:DNA-binding NarL/FixJ family response regulator